MGLFDFLFGLSGRATRLQWWLGQAISYGLSIAAGLWAGLRIAPFLRFDLAHLTREQTLDLLRSLGPALALVWIAAFIAFAVTVRQFHDRDKSGWWSFLPAAPLLILAIAGIEGWTIAVALLMVLFISMWQLVELGCLPGTTGPNDHGAEFDGRLRGLDKEIAAMQMQEARRIAATGVKPAFGRRPFTAS